ncbi:MAG TPA: SPASM domain-containing protein [Elusimicrobiota bacterium]|nr:SPASM domain-containing protein [Elusimicrobiota bacterium]
MLHIGTVSLYARDLLVVIDTSSVVPVLRGIKYILRGLFAKGASHRRWGVPWWIDFYLRFTVAGLMGKSVRLEASTLCRLQCPLCIHGDDGMEWLGRGYLKFRDFKTFVDLHPGYRYIELSNYGEIFMNPELKDIIEYANHKKIGLLALNGVHFNEVREEMMECMVKNGFKAMTVSIDGASEETYQTYRRGGRLKTVIENIERLNEIKRKYGSQYPVLYWQFVVFAHNEHELADARHMARRLNMYFIPQCNWSPSYAPRTGTTDIGIVPQTLPCHQLWISPQINWDGRLLGCCVNHWDDYGNVFESGLERLLGSPKYRLAKKMFNHPGISDVGIPCDRCLGRRQRAVQK